MLLSVIDLADLKRHLWHAQLFKSKLYVLNRRCQHLDGTPSDPATVHTCQSDLSVLLKHKVGATSPEGCLGAKEMDHAAK